VTGSARAALVLGGAAAAIALVAVVLRAPVAPPASASGYVGSAACAPCHASLARAWEGSAHHQAMLPAAPASSLRAPHDAPPLVVRDGRLLMSGEQLGHPVDVPVGYVLGRNQVEQYLGWLQPDRLQALPLAFEVRGGRWFDLFEGEERRPEEWGHWTNRGLNADSQCLFCHTTGYDKGYRPATDGYASHWIEMGVGCEACHGPGAAHVAARSGRAATDPYRAHDPAALLDACASCHSRRVERGPYQPGEHFLDGFEPDLPDTDAYYADGQVREELYEVVSFQMSKMFAHDVRCWSCHDVHGGGTLRSGNALCLGCHASTYAEPAHVHHTASSPGAQCVGCHMPITVYMKHDPRRDHAFTRPDPEATIALGIPNACNRCHDDRPAAWAAELVRTWFPDDAGRTSRRARAATIAQARHGDPASVPALLALLAGDADAVRRASAARLLARFPTATGVTAGLVTALRDPEPLVRAGSAWALGQRSALEPEVRDGLLGVLEDPVRIVRLQAALGLRDLDPGTLGPQAAHALTVATAEWRASQELAGDTPEAHYNLAIFHAARGEIDAAETEYRAALRLWPASIQARHNLGMLLAEQGRLAEAGVEFEAVLARDPVPETAFALGLLRAQEERWPDAVAALERCLAADAGYPRARYNLGLAYARAGDSTRALDTLERAAADPDTHADAVRAIIDVARGAHDRPRLERWLVEASRLDPAVAENPELRELLGR
jgi:Tfp pilus assembly protein PilF